MYSLLRLYSIKNIFYEKNLPIYFEIEIVFNFVGFGERERGHCCGCLNIDIQKPNFGYWDGRLWAYSRWSCNVQWSQKEEQMKNLFMGPSWKHSLSSPTLCVQHRASIKAFRTIRIRLVCRTIIPLKKKKNSFYYEWKEIK